MDNQFRISSHSHPNPIARAIAKSVRDGKPVLLQAIGPGAVHQAVKAIAIARSHLLADNLDVVFVCDFTDFDLDSKERTVVCFHLHRPGHPFPPAKPIARGNHLATERNGA